MGGVRATMTSMLARYWLSSDSAPDDGRPRLIEHRGGTLQLLSHASDHDDGLAGGGKDSVKLPQFRAINTVLSNLKTALCGTYHAFDFVKYAPRYLAEAQYRFNRRFDLRSILRRLLRAAAVTLPCPAQIIRAAEPCP